MLFNSLNSGGKTYNALSVLGEEREYIEDVEEGEENILDVNEILSVYLDLSGNDLKVDTLIRYKLNKIEDIWNEIERYTYDEKYCRWMDIKTGAIKEDIQKSFDYYLKKIMEEKLKVK